MRDPSPAQIARRGHLHGCSDRAGRGEGYLSEETGP